LFQTPGYGGQSAASQIGSMLGGFGSAVGGGVKDAYNYATTGSAYNPSGGGGSGPIRGTGRDDEGNLMPGFEDPLGGVGNSPVYTGNYYNYYTSPEYFQSQDTNSLLNSSSTEGLDFIP